MTEKLLQFIWKNRYFNQKELQLVSGESVIIEHPGKENKDQGPDFVNARIRIHGNCWIGSVELHLYSSGWIKHSHSDDENYYNVILHVFWKLDYLDLKRNIPQLELCNRIPVLMLETYAAWMLKPSFIPCESSISKIKYGHWESLAYAIMTMRLNRKMADILDSLQKNQYHWEEQLWWMIASNFGNPVNTNAFEAIARSIPFTLIAKHRHQFIQLEALFLGQANLLEKNFMDSYPILLKKEYNFLKKKYGLKKVYVPVHFLRMRPENFPGVRLSQLASLCAETGSLFSWSLECKSLSLLRKKFMVGANDYWHDHYIFDKKSLFREKRLGQETSNMIIINSIIPLLYTYGKIVPDLAVLNKVMIWIDQMPAEKNHQMENWKRMGVPVKNATGSQALAELKKNYCDQRKCLECEIGKTLLLPFETRNPD